ncbi:hypothetical protein SAPIO_CDS3877 [Scedosporium apiospermum]|uniref:Uncharacterized protein n=1 Tax=Pseudallescheria apiosperma TaxID=563466 RepID=A0A084G9U7_PSEDA|nr:uncharacterized protein SAPIO_CDS3877 [Scedosporium apiospermum]KEZ44109.1 hypothetical protein SAPIO_CDS3877 [Scedosporium apiospermum]
MDWATTLFERYVSAYPYRPGEAGFDYEEYLDTDAVDFGWLGEPWTLRELADVVGTTGDYPEQRANIEAIIRYYEAGGRLPKAGVEVLYCFDGENVKVGSHEDLTHEHVARKAVGWVDAGQTKKDVDSSPSTIEAAAPGYLQMAESVACPVDAASRMHTPLAQFRIPYQYGGDETIVINATICNDTGSRIRTIYEHDFNLLNGPPASRHTFPPQPLPINTPNGVAMAPTVSMLIALLSAIKVGRSRP